MFLSLPVSDLNSEGDSEMSLITTFTTASDREPDSQGDSDSELRSDLALHLL